MLRIGNVKNTFYYERFLEQICLNLSGPVRAPGRNASLIQLLILVLCILFGCLYHMLPHLSFLLHFLTYLLPYLSLPLRIDPLRFPVGCHKRH